MIDKAVPLLSIISHAQMFKLLSIILLGYVLYRISFSGSTLAKAEKRDQISPEDPEEFTEYEEVE